MSATGGRRDLALVAIGAMAGALLRHAFSVVAAAAPGAWPWSTLAANLLASLLIGIIATRLADRHLWVRPLLVAGFLGGLSTYSAFALETVTLAQAHGVGLAAAYVGATVAGCVASVYLGALIARLIVRTA